MDELTPSPTFAPTTGESSASHEEMRMANTGWTQKGLIHWITLCEDGEHIRQYVNNPHLIDFGEKESAVTELFFDLVFVTAVGRINEDYNAHELSLENYVQYFFAVWFFWRSSTLYASLFASDDLWHKLFYAFYGLGIIFLAMHCQGGWDEYTAKMFALSASYLTFLLSICKFRVFAHLYYAHYKNHLLEREKTVAWHCFGLSVSLLITSALWFAASYLETKESRRFCFWVVSLCYPICESTIGWKSGDDKCMYPQVAHLDERMEAFMLIVLGETVNGVTRNPMEQADPHDLYLCCTLGFLVLFFMKLLHFDVEDYDEDIHALRQGFTTRTLWIYFLCLEGMGMALMGAGIANVVDVTSAGKGTHIGFGHHSVYLGLGIALVGGVLARLCHKIDIEDFPYAEVIWYVMHIGQFSSGILALCIPLIFDEMSYGNSLGIALGILIVLNIIGLADEVTELMLISAAHDIDLQEQSKLLGDKTQVKSKDTLLYGAMEETDPNEIIPTEEFFSVKGNFEPLFEKPARPVLKNKEKYKLR